MGNNCHKSTPIVHESGPVTLLGGGEVGPGDLNLALKRANTLVAADSGAQAALSAGVMPDAVIGDMDSLSGEARAKIPPDRLFPIREQDSTDFDKALRSITAPLVLGVGFLGARVDHQLATFNALVRQAERPCILIGPHEIVFHAPPVLEVDLAPGQVVSLFPLSRVSGQSSGLEWPIDGLDFAPDGTVGTSNRSLGPIRIEMSGPGMLMFLPRAALDRVMQALLAPERVPWPAREE